MCTYVCISFVTNGVGPLDQKSELCIGAVLSSCVLCLGLHNHICLHAEKLVGTVAFAGILLDAVTPQTRAWGFSFEG